MSAHHGRGANNTGYIKQVMRKDGIRYEARWRNRWLGCFETRARAQRAIEDAKGVKPCVRERGDEIA